MSRNKIKFNLKPSSSSTDFDLWRKHRKLKAELIKGFEDAYLHGSDIIGRHACNWSWTSIFSSVKGKGTFPWLNPHLQSYHKRIFDGISYMWNDYDSHQSHWGYRSMKRHLSLCWYELPRQSIRYISIELHNNLSVCRKQRV